MQHTQIDKSAYATCGKQKVKYLRKSNQLMKKKKKKKKS